MRSSTLRRAHNTILLCILEACHSEVVWQLELRLLIALQWLEIDNQTLLYGEHGVVTAVLVCAVKYLCDYRSVAWCIQLDFC